MLVLAAHEEKRKKCLETRCNNPLAGRPDSDIKENLLRHISECFILILIYSEKFLMKNYRFFFSCSISQDVSLLIQMHCSFCCRTYIQLLPALLCVFFLVFHKTSMPHIWSASLFILIYRLRGPVLKDSQPLCLLLCAPLCLEHKDHVTPNQQSCKHAMVGTIYQVNDSER